MDDLKRYEELVKTIEYHNDRYYNQDDPEISDYEYDMMMKELKKIEKDHCHTKFTNTTCWRKC